jgi:hypothetical protein
MAIQVIAHGRTRNVMLAVTAFWSGWVGVGAGSQGLYLLHFGPTGTWTRTGAGGLLLGCASTLILALWSSRLVAPVTIRIRAGSQLLGDHAPSAVSVPVKKADDIQAGCGETTRSGLFVVLIILAIVRDGHTSAPLLLFAACASNTGCSPVSD